MLLASAAMVALVLLTPEDFGVLKTVAGLGLLLFTLFFLAPWARDEMGRL